MSAEIQYDLFETTTEKDVLRADLDELSQSHHAVRKKLFGQISSLSKMVLDQQQQIEFLLVKLNLACPLDKSQS